VGRGRGGKFSKPTRGGETPYAGLRSVVPALLTRARWKALQQEPDASRRRWQPRQHVERKFGLVIILLSSTITFLLPSL